LTFLLCVFSIVPEEIVICGDFNAKSAQEWRTLQQAVSDVFNTAFRHCNPGNVSTSLGGKLYDNFIVLDDWLITE
jgi:endonuclease/exonuclease/phosphatase family metal-dependent hydrolase